MANKIIETNVEVLIPDNKNFNKHTEYGMHILEESIRKFGLGRSILIDKNNFFAYRASHWKVFYGGSRFKHKSYLINILPCALLNQL